MSIQNNEATTTVRNLVERVFSVFGPPETLHSDGGREFENDLVKEFQKDFGYKKTRTESYRAQESSTLERVHSTTHNTVAICSTLNCDN